MRKVLFIILSFFFLSCSQSRNSYSWKTPLTQVSFNLVKLEDNFWKPRLNIQSQTLVPYAFNQTWPAVENLQKTAQFLQGDTTELPFPHRYIASDLYKTMEGAAYILMNNPDSELERKMDEIIEIISKAQKEDGYLYEAHITGVSKNHDHWGGGGMGDKPYSFVLHSHELYNMGHMYEAAVAYYLATGKDKWLKLSEKNAQHINKVFFEGDPCYNNGIPVNQAPGHQEIELALVKLYNVTGKRLYLDMAYRFLEIRGKTFIPQGTGVMSPTYSQQHLPVAQQTKATGHAVRAMYQYCAMADVSNHLDNHDYKIALDSIWENLVDKKMHITGGLGALHGIEGFGPDYELPNKETYNETCAAVGNVLFNYRMFLLTRDSKYVDVAEVALYNNVLAGINLEGNKFFYVNPLEHDGITNFNHGHSGRAPWFGTACCPTNLARLIPQVSGMMYSFDSYNIFLTLYASSSTEIMMANDQKVEIQQLTNYPFDGRIELIVNPETDKKFKLHLRIPTWAQGEKFLPGDLYTYVSNSSVSEWAVLINGVSNMFGIERGFVTIERDWSSGDRIEFDLGMNVCLNKSNDLVKENLGKLALTRGPLLYCLEGESSDVSINDYRLTKIDDMVHSTVSFSSDTLLKDIPLINLPMVRDTNNMNQLLRHDFIPYYAWNNRGNKPMLVWINSHK